MKISLLVATGLGLGFSSVLFCACGGSSDDDKGGNQGGAGGTAGGAGGASAGGASTSGGAPGAGGAPAPLLGPDIAGKACTGNAECTPSGKCVQRLTAGPIGEALGIGVDVAGGYCTATCTTDTECNTGGVCFLGECRKGCSADGDCRDGYECASQGAPVDVGGMQYTLPKTCQPKPVVDHVTSGVGKACSGVDGGTECGDGECLTGPTFPGGYCTGACVADADCGTEAICVRGVYGSLGACWEPCSADTDCARDQSGYGCVDLGGQKVCAVKQEPLKGSIGKACTDDSTCAPGTCAHTLPSNVPLGAPIPAPGGYCTLSPCTQDVDCGEGGVCMLTTDGFGCMKACTTEADCGRSGYVCELRGATATNSKVCAPPAPTTNGGATPDAGTCPDASGDGG